MNRYRLRVMVSKDFRDGYAQTHIFAWRRFAKELRWLRIVMARAFARIVT